jgi:acylphosphatase
MNLHYKINISGRVQGVGFRFETRRMARIFGIKGFVKNMNHGGVYIEAEGSAVQIREFLTWCKKGPVHSRVDEVSTEMGELKGFEFFDIV